MNDLSKSFLDSSLNLLLLIIKSSNDKLFSFELNKFHFEMSGKEIKEVQLKNKPAKKIVIYIPFRNIR